MKNKTPAALCALVLVFCGFTGGFFCGRNTRISAIQTTKTVYETLPAETVIVMREVLVTLPPETTAPPAETSAPSKSTPAKQTEEKATKPTEPKVAFPVNINTASAQELAMLPGIGEVFAQNITAYREANGNFLTPEELLNVEGIGPSRLEAILDYITVGGTP
jgi:competence ComEA-like helix-hairpin-helix protein